MLVTIDIKSEAIEKVLYILNSLPDVTIINKDDLSYLENEIEKGLKSGISNETHEDIIINLKQQYV